MNGDAALRTLLLYHLVETVHGQATRIDVALRDARLVTSDDGRGMGADRTVANRPYVDLAFGQLRLLDADGPPLEPDSLQLHAVGLSLLAEGCEDLELVIRRSGLRREGVWKRGPGRFEWSEPAPCTGHGTEVSVRPDGGLPAAGLARAVVEGLRRRHPEVRFGLQL